MISFPSCKINLGLHILFKRDDNYHEVETVMYPIPLNDILEIVPADELIFTSSGLAIPGKVEDNLCLKAYHLLKNEFDIPPVHIHLHKIIPMGGGLGGGSSNGAFTLKLLNDLFQLNLSTEELKEKAAQLGSDCAFFIENSPQVCTGRGEITTSIELDLSTYYLKIVNLGIHVSTAEAYGGIVPFQPTEKIAQIIQKAISTWKGKLKNDFEEGVFRNHPELLEAKNRLYKEGAIYASMTGSGSTMFGLFESQPQDSFPESHIEHIVQLG
jgi:4-diphosphocytidyl-2-C-methyl-D-erythritol kinase